jgi:hypothetical protein
MAEIASWNALCICVRVLCPGGAAGTRFPSGSAGRQPEVIAFNSIHSFTVHSFTSGA